VRPAGNRTGNLSLMRRVWYHKTTASAWKGCCCGSCGCSNGRVLGGRFHYCCLSMHVSDDYSRQLASLSLSLSLSSVHAWQSKSQGKGETTSPGGRTVGRLPTRSFLFLLLSGWLHGVKVRRGFFRSAAAAAAAEQSETHKTIEECLTASSCCCCRQEGGRVAEGRWAV
jgi:hypothetical protein